ncbi:MAG: hypothetical protein JW726_12970, partial [Anaerolineales bacterium]|nr:hypothetical protein [Anaerolineales bacterium]
MPTLVLALPSPIWFLLALILVFLSILAVPSLNFVLVVLLIVGVPLLGLVYLFARLPDIFRYLWKLIGPFGERLLHFIESSPERLLKSYADAWASDVTRVSLYFANHAHPRLLNDHSVRAFFRLIGLPSENLLEQYLHNPHIRHQQPVKIVHTLGKLGAFPNLLRLGKDSATRDEIRAMAAAELEFREMPEDAAIVWDALGRESSSIFHQLQAADHLIRLKHTSQAQDILDEVTADEDLDPRWRDKAFSLQRRLNNVSPLSRVSPVITPASQEPLDQLQAART